MTVRKSIANMWENYQQTLFFWNMYVCMFKTHVVQKRNKSISTKKNSQPLALPEIVVTSRYYPDNSFEKLAHFKLVSLNPGTWVPCFNSFDNVDQTLDTHR